METIYIVISVDHNGAWYKYMYRKAGKNGRKCIKWKCMKWKCIKWKCGHSMHASKET